MNANALANLRDGEEAVYLDLVGYGTLPFAPAIVWDGNDMAMIDSPSDPFLTTLDGEKIDLAAIEQAGTFARGTTDCEGCGGGLMDGVFAPVNDEFGIEVCGECRLFAGDLEAAEALGAHLLAQGLLPGPVQVMYHPHETDPSRA